MEETAAANTPTELGTEKISTLLRHYALPSIIAMTAASLYNIVDSIFIGRGAGALAMSALAVTFPLTNLSAAFGTLVGVGASTMISVLLGQKNYVSANKVLGNVVSLNTILGIAFTLITLAFIDPILYFFGASDNTIGLAKDYMVILLWGNVFTHLYFGLNSAMRASGNPRTAMGLTLFTVFFNAVLDPIFIFALDMGIKGAAWATVISQVLALVIVMYKFCDRKAAVHFEKGIMKLDWKIARDSLSIGMGPFLMNAASCIVIMFINRQILAYCGDMGVGAYGICHRISFLFIMICAGINQGMQPIAGYNFGARKYSRVKEVYNRTVIIETVVLTLFFVLSTFCPKTIVSVFTSDQTLLDLSARGMRIMNCVAFVIAFHMVTTNLFQCLGMVRKSIFLSLIRQLIYLVPLLWILPKFMGGDGVWWSFPISDFLAFVTAYFFRVDLIKKLSGLKDGDKATALGGKLS